MRSTALRLAALALALGACEAPAESGPRAAGAQPSPAPRAAPSEIVPELAERVLELYGRADVLAAQDLAAEQIRARVVRGEWSDEVLLADSVAAVELWSEAVHAHDTWPRALQALAPLEPLPASTPWELAAALERLHAAALRVTGSAQRAREKSRALGVVTDWQVVGPFDNERGAGFDVAHPPQREIDLAAALRGKERDVRWRVNPVPEHPLGRIALDDLLRPKRQVAAYLATAIATPRAREVALLVGCSSALKVFVNGRTALARKVRRPFHPDQDAVVVPLEPGVNQILLELAIEEWPEWVVETRFVELDGRPARDLAVDSALAATPTLPGREPSGRAPRDAAAVLAEREGDPHAARLAALLAILRGADDVASKRAVELAVRARELAPEDPNALWLVAWAREPSVISTPAERDVEPELAALRALVEREPRHAVGWLSLAWFYLRADPIPTRALECAARAREAAPGSWVVANAYAAALRGVELHAQAERVLDRALELGDARTSAAAILRRARDLRARGEREAALALLAEAFDAHATPGQVLDELVRQAVDAGRLADDPGGAPSVEGLARRALAAAPFAFDARLALARAFEGGGDLARARDALEAARRLAPEDPELLRTAARLALREDDLGRAEIELDELLRLDPGDALARRQRAWLAASSRERFEEPFRRDARELVGAAAPPGARNEPVLVLDRTLVVRVGSDGGESAYEHVVLRAENAGGVKALDRYAVPYPSGATLEVLELRVLHADGRVESAPPPPRDQGAGGMRVRVYDVPPLAVGDVLDVEYRVDQTEPDVFGEYFGLSHVFYADAPDPLAPVARSELVVLTPPDVEIHAFERNGERLERSVGTDAEGRTVHRWVARDLERPPLELAMPPREELAPRVDLTTFASWDAFARWWWALIEDEFVATPAMKAKVEELTAGLSAERDKVRALARFVGQEIRYNAWEFGPHGYQPYSAPTIFERRFGDCKDKSILLVELLKLIGVDANPVVIAAEHFRPEESLDAAMVEHFNHCIAYVKPTPEREGYYLDATADRNPIEYLRADDQGAKVLHVDGSGGSIHSIPYAPPDENARVRALRVELEPDGSGTVRYRDRSNGYFGVELRHRFGGEKGDLAKRFADSAGEAFGRVEVARIETSTLEDIGEPARLDCEFRANHLWAREAGGATLRLAFERFGLDRIAAEAPSERRFDVVLDRPFLEDLDLTYVLPAGTKLVELPPSVDVRAEGLCSYSLGVEHDGDEIRIRRRFRLDERRIPLARYADFREAMQAIRRAEERAIRVEPPALEGGGGQR